MLLTFQHLKGLHRVNAAFDELLGLHLEQLIGSRVNFKGILAFSFEQQVFLVNLSHDIVMFLNLVEVEPMELLGLLSNSCEEFVLLSQLHASVVVW